MRADQKLWMSVLSSESGGSSVDLVGDVQVILQKLEQKSNNSTLLAYQEMRDGSSLGGLSAKATEFVSDARNGNFEARNLCRHFLQPHLIPLRRPGGCGGAFQGLSSKATEYVPVSEFKTEGAGEGAKRCVTDDRMSLSGAGQPWGWNAFILAFQNHGFRHVQQV